MKQADRDSLRTKLKPPGNWLVWFGGYDGTMWKNLTIHQNRGLIQVAAVGGPTIRTYEVSATTFGMGHVLFLVVGGPQDEAFDTLMRSDTNYFFRVCPPKARSILWPPARLLTDPDANKIANVLTLSGAFDQSRNPLANWTFAL